MANRSKLAVILHADVVGSTVLVQKDERVAHDRLQSVFRRLSDMIGSYGGTTLELRGDALVGEFDRASDAVSAALSFQAANRAHNERYGDDIRPEIRIGISLGEVVIADRTVTGAGVVLAQRLEQLAEPGGLCISAAIREALPARLPFQYGPLGEQTLKGFDDPVRVFFVAVDEQGRIPAPEPVVVPAVIERGARRDRLGLMATVLALLLLVGGVAFWLQPWKSRIEPVRQDKMAYALPDKPSIAVLPLANLSNDPEQAYFADGMTEDLITDLSKLSGLFVIARHSVFAYKGKAVKVAQVAEQLGVRYVLEGSVRRAGGQLRINAQLIDAMSGGHLWAERYDGNATDVFALQDRVTGAIVEALAVTLLPSEAQALAKPDTEIPEAHDAFLVGLAHHRSKTSESLAKAKTALERAVALDPNFARAWAVLTELYFHASYRDLTKKLGLDMNDIPALLERSLTRPTVEGYEAQLHWLNNQSSFDDMTPVIQRMVALDSNYPDTYGWRGLLAARNGDTASAIVDLRRAVRLDPHKLDNLGPLGKVELQAGRVSEAIPLLERAVTGDSHRTDLAAALTAAYALSGRIDDAQASAERLVALRKSQGHLVTLTGSFGRERLAHPDYQQQLRDGLRLAGIPDKVREEDLNLSPAHRVTGQELREKYREASMAIGEIAAGRWMNESFPDGTRVHYWLGREYARSDWSIEGDESVVRYRAPSTRADNRCSIYRNPSGTKESLDEYIGVCDSGVYTYSTFPLERQAE